MRYIKRVAAIAIAATALLVPASGAMGATAPGYEEFDACPSKTVNANIGGCATVDVTGGYLKLGNKTTPITDPLRLVTSITTSGEVVLGEFDGGRQIVPGGLPGITGLEYLHWLFPFSLLQLYAEAELAGPPGLPLEEPVHLPLKVKLEGALLNNTCYIGSNANPINLNLITSTTSPPPPNTPISGDFGTGFFLDDTLPLVGRIHDMVLVDNAFSVPGANGCDLFGFGLINGLVNSQVGLPSAAGRNTAVQEADVAVSMAIETVYPPNGFE